MVATRSGTLTTVGYWVVTAVAVTATAIFVFFGVRFHPLLTNSMGPELPAGSVIITIPATTQDLREGDVIKLPLPDGSGHDYVHRIADILPKTPHTTVVTQGDNNANPDPWVLEILSTTTPLVVASIPYLGHVNSLTSGFAPRLLLISVVMGSLSLVLLRSLKRPRRVERQPRHLEPPPGLAPRS
jgi:signal peptidase I